MAANAPSGTGGASPGGAGHRGLFLLLAIILALLISVGGSYLIVASQNPSSNVKGPAFVYGSASP